jgi:hypothetical protein
MHSLYGDRSAVYSITIAGRMGRVVGAFDVVGRASHLRPVPARSKLRPAAWFTNQSALSIFLSPPLCDRHITYHACRRW